MYTKINNFQMYYDERGTGLPLLLIHGFPLNHMMWEPQISSLSAQARVIAPDLRGHGSSQAAPPPTMESQVYKMQMHADDCAALLDDLGITQPVVIAGLSMGGYIALAFLQKYPERVAGLILAATRAGADSPAARDNRLKAVATAKESGIGAVVDAMTPKLLSLATYNNQTGLPTRLAAIMANISLDAMIGDQLGMLNRPDSTAMLDQINVPTLLIYGADDQIIPLEDMQIMRAKIPASELHVVLDAGHMVNMEQPQQFNQAVREFLQRKD